MDDLTRWSCRPDALLSPFIDRYWGWRMAAGQTLPLLLPGTSSECFFHWGTPPLAAPGVPLPRAYLISPRAQSRHLLLSQPVEFLAVRFKSGQLRHLTALPLADAFDQFMPLSEVWPHQAESLETALCRASTTAARIEQLNQFFRHCLHQHHHSSDALPDRVIDDLYYHPALRVEQIGDHYGLSARQLERRFISAFGLTPKRFARLARLQHAVRDMALHPQEPAVERALRHGFSDQSHFIHDIRAFTGLTPGALAEQLQNGHHFYHPPSHGPAVIASP